MKSFKAACPTCSFRITISIEGQPENAKAEAEELLLSRQHFQLCPACGAALRSETTDDDATPPLTSGRITTLSA